MRILCTIHPPYTIPFPLTGERDVSFWRYGVRCFISKPFLLVYSPNISASFFSISSLRNPRARMVPSGAKRMVSGRASIP